VCVESSEAEEEAWKASDAWIVSDCRDSSEFRGEGPQNIWTFCRNFAVPDGMFDLRTAVAIAFFALDSWPLT